MAAAVLSRAAYEPEYLWTPRNLNFPDNKFSSNRRPAPLDLTATRRPRRSRSSPAVAHFSHTKQDEATRKPRPSPLTENFKSEQSIEPPLPTSTEITVGFEFGFVKPETQEAQTESARTSISLSSQTDSAAAASSAHKENISQTEIPSYKETQVEQPLSEDVVDMAKLSPFYIPNIRSGLASPQSSTHTRTIPPPSPNHSLRSVASTMTIGSGPLSARSIGSTRSTRTVMGLPPSPKPDRGRLSPRLNNPPTPSVRSVSPRPASVKSQAESTLTMPLLSPPPTIVAVSSPTLSVASEKTAMDITRQRTPPPPPYSRAPNHAHSNSDSYKHSTEWDAVEALLLQVRMQQKQLEELQWLHQQHLSDATDIKMPGQVQEYPKPMERRERAKTISTPQEKGEKGEKEKTLGLNLGGLEKIWNRSSSKVRNSEKEKKRISYEIIGDK